MEVCMNSYSSSRRSNRASGWLVVMVAMAAAGAPAAAGAGQVAKKVVALTTPQLHVRDLSGDFTKWLAAASLTDNEMVKEFRWSVARSDAATARYEMTYGRNQFHQQEMVIPKPRGTPGFFTIDFKPFLNQWRGSVGAPIVFSLRIVPLNLEGNPLYPTSQTVKLTYLPPSGALTRFDSAMALILKSVKCVDTTSGDGSDQMIIRVIGHKSQAGGVANSLFSERHTGFDNGDAIL